MSVVLVFFVGLIAVEVFYSRRKGLSVYRFHESVSHFTTGVGQMVFNAIWFAGLAVIYVWIGQFAPFTFELSNLWAWAATLIVADFLWYVSHRASHRVNFFVATHAVHHQANDFNHASALRQSWTSRPALFVFFAPLALAGIPAEMVLGSAVISGAIQFLSHNGVIKRKLGPLEWVLVTPRTHFVHHGINAPYLDRNFGGMFIVWDRLFGTFVDLDEANPPRIGTLDRMNHFDPIECNLNYFRRLFFVSRRREGLFGKLSIWWQTPETLSSELSRLGYEERSRPVPELPLSSQGRWMIYGLVTAVIGATVQFTRKDSPQPFELKVGLGLFILIGLWLIGQLLSGRWGSAVSSSSTSSNAAEG